jgi:hypothetical protein
VKSCLSTAALCPPFRAIARCLSQGPSMRTRDWILLFFRDVEFLPGPER